MIGPVHTPNLQSGPVGLRSIRTRDAPEWRALRTRNRDWLVEWDATTPAGAQDIAPTFSGMVRSLRAEARAGRTLPWVISYNGRLVGQMTVGGIAYGSLRSAHIGYWVDQNHAGRGIVPTAVALGADYCFFTLGLHRLEINLRPENIASRRVVEKLGFRYEGIRENFLHINGQWRDHLAFAVTAEDAPKGVLARLQQSSATQ